LQARFATSETGVQDSRPCRDIEIKHTQFTGVKKKEFVYGTGSREHKNAAMGRKKKPKKKNLPTKLINNKAGL
jgi:hypothetical protein